VTATPFISLGLNDKHSKSMRKTNLDFYFKGEICGYFGLDNTDTHSPICNIEQNSKHGINFLF
jgi:hypothetical protein